MGDKINNGLGKQLDNRLAFKSGMLYLIDAQVNEK